jgi:hypothetical protein
MLTCLWQRHGVRSERKLRLVACGCCRQVWSVLDKVDQRAVDAAEKFADGLLNGRGLLRWRNKIMNLRQASRALVERVSEVAHLAAEVTLDQSGYMAANHAQIAEEAEALATSRIQKRGRPLTCATFREIFGNPFRSVTADLAWCTATVVQLAQCIYTDRAFDRLPILADALEEAGCTDAEILSHCRGPGPHVRGCWVVDLVLGKE